MNEIVIDILPVRRSSSIYGNGSGELVLSDLNCNGTEANLVECSISRLPRVIMENRVCDHSEDAGVRCGGMFVPAKANSLLQEKAENVEYKYYPSYLATYLSLLVT